MPPLPTDQNTMENSMARTRLLLWTIWNHCINFLFLLKPSYVQKVSIIAQFSLKRSWILSEGPGVPDHTHMNELVTHSWHKTGSLFLTTLDMSRHALPHPLEATNRYLLLYGPLVTSKNSTSCLNLFVRYSSLKNPGFWLALRFLNHKSRTRFFPNMLFLQKVKRPFTILR